MGTLLKLAAPFVIHLLLFGGCGGAVCLHLLLSASGEVISDLATSVIGLLGGTALYTSQVKTVRYLEIIAVTYLLGSLFLGLLADDVEDAIFKSLLVL